MRHIVLGFLLIGGGVAAADLAPPRREPPPGMKAAPELAKDLVAAVKGNDAATLTLMMTGVRVTIPEQATAVLKTEAAARDWVRDHALEVKAVASCGERCCTFDAAGPWAEKPYHPTQACFSQGRLRTLMLERGAK